MSSTFLEEITVASGGQFRLLLVEDNSGDADLVRERLASVPEGDFELIHVTRLEQALGILGVESIDAVILDLNLPDSRGIETLRRVRGMRDDVAVVVLSASGSEDLRRLALREGAQDFLGKDEPIARLLARSVLYALERNQSQEQQRQIRDLVRAHPDALVVTDTSGVIQFMNGTAMGLLGPDRDDVIRELPGFLESRDQAIEIEISKDDERRTVEVRSVNIEWMGQPAYLAAMRDTTERKRLSEQLQQAQKMEAVGRLAGGVAHDFNNLLTVIGGYVDVLLDAAPEGDFSREYLSEVLKATQRAAALTRQLLSLSRSSVEDPRWLNLNSVIEDMEKMVRRLTGEDIRLTLTLDPNVGLILADPSQVEQVLLNLVVNARDAMPVGGEVVIETRSLRLEGTESIGPVDVEPGLYAELEISDTGEGMSETIRSRIFEPFFTTKPPGKGTGLGLSIVYGIVKGIGGHLHVESQIGEGSVFRVLLPAIDPAQAATDRGESRLLAPMGDETVLLVEDETGVRKLARLILETAGYQVLEAKDGREALEIARSYPYRIDLLLTDVVMPEMGGRQLAERLRKDRNDLRVLYTSGYADAAVVRHGVSRSERSFLGKPFSPTVLARKVREVLDREGGDQ